MALKPRQVEEEKGYVSTITAEDLAAYADGYADGYDSDEFEEENQYAEIEKKKTFGDKLSAAKMAVKNFSLPSPDEIKNSNFCKSFQQPLMVKTKVQASQVQQSNSAITKGKTPAELSKISKLSDFPLPSFKRHTDASEAPEKTETEPEESIYGTLSRSLRETKLVTAVVESEVDDEELIKRMEVTKSATPAQLAEIKSIKDIPIPDSIKHLLDKPAKPVTNGVAHVETNGEDENQPKAAWAEGFLETKLVTNVKECTDYGTLKKRQDLIKNKTPAELSAITSIGDLPVPSKISNMFSGGDKEKASDGASSQGFNMGNPLQDGISVPEGFKIKLAVKAIVEDEEIVQKNKELIANKSVAELGKVTSISDFPVPEAFGNLMKKKEGGAEVKASNLSLSAIASGKIFPESLRETKLITNIKVEKDQEKLMARQSIVKTQTPMELGSVRNLSDFPVPARLQHLTHLKLPVFGNPNTLPTAEGVSDYPTPPPRNKSCNASIYESLPGSLRNELIVNVKTETLTDEESKARMEIIRSKSPIELSQIGSLKDVPIPRNIEKLFESKDDQDENNKEEEGMSMAQKFSTLPASLKTNLLVGAKVEEDQDLVQQRSETIKAKSVVELSEIRSVSDFPLPSTLTRLAKRDYAPVERKKLFKQQMKSQSTQSLTNSLQSTLPRSLRETQLLVSSKVHDPDVLESRRSLAEGKSIAELSKVTSLADIPVPSFFSKMASKSLSRLNFSSNGHLQDPDQVDSKPDSGIYATLPKSLNCELLVSKSIQDVSLLEQRMELVKEKSTKELAHIGSMKDFPVPENLKNFYYKSMERLNGGGDGEGLTRAKSTPTLKLPTMLTQPCIVKTKVEDPQVLLERQQIQQQKSIHELSKIRNLNEIPIPGNRIKLPDVPLPKITMKSLLQVIAKTPQRKPSPSLSKHIPDTPSEMSEQQYEEESNIEEEYSNLEDSYEVISKEPTESPQVEVEPFGLASQIKGTPERNTRSKKKKPESKNRRSQVDNEEPPAAAEGQETPPPLPPKRSPQKSFSFDSQQSVEVEGSPSPVKGVLTLEAMNGNIQVIKNEVHGNDGIQSRPLPPPPAPVRYGRVKETDRTLVEESQKFQTCRESLTTDHSRTLIGTDDDDNTMADSIVESLVSCTDTLICDGEDDFDDDPYPSVNFDGGMSELQEEPRSGGKRLEEGTQQLSLELMQHVDSLRNTLDNMSSRLGARSRSRSNDRARSGSRPPSLYRQEK